LFLILGYFLISCKITAYLSPEGWGYPRKAIFQKPLVPIKINMMDILSSQQEIVTPVRSKAGTF
jgi:hypothetical protein